MSGTRTGVVQHLRTPTSNNPPAPNTLLDGELCIEQADPMKLWVGVPTTMDPTGQKLLYSASANFVDAPSDTFAYGRLNAAWAQVLPLTGGQMTGPINMAAGSTGVTLLAGTDLFVMGAANGANFVAPTQVNTAFGTWATQNIGFGVDNTTTPPRLRWKANGIDLGVIASGVVGGGDYLPLAGGTLTGDLVIAAALTVTPPPGLVGTEITLTGGEATGAIPFGGAVTLRGGRGVGNAGSAAIIGGDASGGIGGGVSVQAGNGSAKGGPATIRGGSATATGMVGGVVLIQSGSANNDAANAALAGDIILQPGLSGPAASVPRGRIIFEQLPTVAQAADTVWNNNGVLNIGVGGSSTVVHDASLTGTGVTGTPLAVAQATATQLAGARIATAAEINAGLLDTTIMTPFGLRGVTGDKATLVTTNKTALVPAINEIYNTIAQLTGVVIYAGSYDAATKLATFNGQGGITAGSAALPAAAASNHGAYLITTVAGAGGGPNEPAGAIGVGDWVLSDGVGWVRLAFGGQAAVTAPQVAMSPVVGLMGPNVQTALTWLDTNKLNLAGGQMTGPLNMAAGATGVNLLDGTDLFVMGAANGANFVAPTQVNTAFGTWATQNIGFGIDDSVSPPRLRWKANGIDLGVIASGVVGGGDYLPLAGGTLTGDLTMTAPAKIFAGRVSGTDNILIQPEPGAIGRNVTIRSATSTAGPAGAIFLTSASSSTAADGGDITIGTGGSTAGRGGDLFLTAGVGATAGGAVRLFSGLAESGTGGSLTIQAGRSNIAGGLGGDLKILSETGINGAHTGLIQLIGGNANGGRAGRIEIIAGGAGNDLNGIAGDILLAGGLVGSGANVAAPGGAVIVDNSPLALNRSAVNEAQINGKLNLVDRWRITLGNNAPEVGGNQGSDFSIIRFADNGDPIDTVMRATRQTGVVDFAFPPTVAGAPIARGLDAGAY